MRHYASLVLLDTSTFTLSHLLTHVHTCARHTAWWNQGIADSPAAANFISELTDKYCDHEPWPAGESELSARLSASLKSLKGKLAVREMDDDAREAKNLVDKIEGQLWQGDPGTLSKCVTMLRYCYSINLRSHCHTF
jgi:hypothetical protein